MTFVQKLQFNIKRTYFFVLTLIALIISLNTFSISAFSLIALLLYSTFTLLFLFLTGRFLQSVMITNSVIICVQFINQMKVHYYKERLFFPDLFVMFDPHNLGTLLEYPLGFLFLIALLLFLCLNIFLFRKTEIITWKMRLLSLFAALLVLSMAFFLKNRNENQDLFEASLPKGKGTLVNLFVTSSQLSYVAPFYNDSADYFLEAMHQHMDQNRSIQTSVERPDIVVFLQESALDTTLYDIDQSPLPHLPLFDLGMNSLLRVQTFGGGTWLSEFSILTGLNSDDFSYRKNAVFYTVAPHIQTSLFKELKAQGYLTVVLSPMGYGNYNAGKAYSAWGMDEFITPQDLGYPADPLTNLWHIPTQEMVNYTKELLRRTTDQPLFIYVLSMYEHGPYDQKVEDKYHLSQLSLTSDFTESLIDYQLRLEQLNHATLDLVHYIQHRERPTLLLYFGDHQPNLSWKGEYKTTLPNPEWLTQYGLVANYPFEKEDHEVVDISLLSGLILEKANIINVSPFYQANQSMRYLCHGKLDDCDDKKLINSYKHYIYQTLKQAGE